MAFDATVVNQVIKSRRSVKQYIKDKQVPDAIIIQALENAT